MLGLQNEREWVVFCERVLGRPELAADERFSSNSRRTAHRQELREIVIAAFAPYTAAQVITRLDEASIANARMNDMGDVWEHPQLAARQRWSRVDTSAGPIRAPIPPGLAPDPAAHGSGPSARPAHRRDPAELATTKHGRAAAPDKAI
jgi:crotonobetainyl-CoA:carnitine CoA-transferase CaiB-like acyl-CoA transferase